MNFLGAIGQLGRLLPGYVEGQRRAYQDNWTDLNQFNQVQRDQIGNAFLEATFPLEYNNAYNTAVNSALATKLNAANATKFFQSFPYELQIGAMQGQYAPSLLQQRVAETLNPSLRTQQQLSGLGISPQEFFGMQQQQQPDVSQYDSALQALVQRIAQLEAMLNNAQPTPSSTPTNWSNVAATKSGVIQ